MSDLISREAAIDSISKCMDIYVNNLQTMVYKAEAYKALTDLPSAEQETHDKRTETRACDLISRQAAIEEIARWIGYIDEDMILRIQTGLKKLPPEEPERKTGRWILKKTYEDEYGNEQFKYFCSECDAPAYEFSQPYCHRCGADMRGEEDELG